MQIVTTQSVPGREIDESIRLVFANGNNLEDAVQKLEREARKWGAHAVVGVGLTMIPDTNLLGIYGTAVKLKK